MGDLWVLSMGVDTVVFSALGEPRAGVVDDLERWRDRAKVEDGRLARVTLPRSGKDFPPLRVELRSSFLHSMTPGPAVQIPTKDFFVREPARTFQRDAGAYHVRPPAARGRP